MDKRTAEILSWSDKILELIDNADELPRGDLQGASEALASQILSAGQKLNN